MTNAFMRDAEGKCCSFQRRVNGTKTGSGGKTSWRDLLVDFRGKIKIRSE